MKNTKFLICSLIIICIAVYTISGYNINSLSTDDLTIYPIMAKTFSSDGYDMYNAVDIDDNGNYVVAGSASGNAYDVAGRNHGAVDGVVAKYDKDGNLLWSKVIGGSKDEYFEEIKILSDGRIAVAGYTESSNSGDIETSKYGWDSSWLMVLDSDGNKLWSSLNGRGGTYGYTSFRAITETSDGNIVCAGYAYGDTPGNIPGVLKGERDTFIAKFDSVTGERLWHKFNGGSKNETFFDVSELKNGNIVAVGQSESNDGDFQGLNKGKFDASVLVYSKNGDLIHVETFGGSGNDNYIAVIRGSNDSILAAGNTESSDGDLGTTYGAVDGLFVSYTINGQYQWQRVIGGNDNDYLTYMTEDVNGNFSVAGYTSSSNSGNIAYDNTGNVDGMFSVIDKNNGDLLELSLFGGTGNDYLQSIAADSTGGYVIVGNTTSTEIDNLPIGNHGLSDALVTKFKTNNLPVITGESFTSIDIHDNFDLTSNIQATDFEDGNIIKKVVIETDFDKDVAGIYSVLYKVVDYENNEATFSRIIVVNDGNYEIGNEYILYASNYSIRSSQVIKDSEDVLKRADVKVWDKFTGSPIDYENAINIEYGEYQYKPGTYSITFNFNDEPTLLNTVNAVVTSGESPNLNIKKYTEIDMGESFDSLDGLSSIDFEDGNITDKVTILNNVDIFKPGIYEVRYIVTDLDSNTVSKTQVVVVKGAGVVTGEYYALAGNNFDIYTGNVTKSGTEIIDYANIRVYDKVNNVFVTNAVSITKNGYTNIEGLYTVNVFVNNEPAVNLNIKTNVIKGTSPKIQNADFTEISIGSYFNENDGIKIIDDRDSEDYLRNKLIINGKVNTKVAGVYTLVYTIIDSDFNETKVTRVVVVNDGTFAIGNDYILRASNYEIKSKNVVVNELDIMKNSKVTVYNKLDGSLNETVNVNVNYGKYSNIPGTYKIEFKVPQDNLASRMINAVVSKGASPIIDASPIIEVNASSNFDFTEYLKVSDKEDGNLIDKVQMLGEFNSSIPGIYNVKYSVFDNDLNETTFNQVIIVNDGNIVHNDEYILMAHSFTISESDVDTSDEAIIKDAEVKVWNTSSGEEVSTDVVEVQKNNYTSTLGTYEINFGIKNSSSISVAINAIVTKSNKEDPIIDTPSNVDKDESPISPLVLKVMKVFRLLLKLKRRKYKKKAAIKDSEV